MQKGASNAKIFPHCSDCNRGDINLNSLFQIVDKFQFDRSDVNDIKVRHSLNFCLPWLGGDAFLLFIIIILAQKIQISKIFGTFQNGLNDSNVSLLATMIAFPTQ